MVAIDVSDQVYHSLIVIISMHDARMSVLVINEMNLGKDTPPKKCAKY